MAMYSREEFKRYVLRELGAPVIKVNITEEQLDDRIDEALDFWQQYHNEGTIRTLLKVLITATTLHVVESDVSKVENGAHVRGLTSGATGKITEYTAKSGRGEENGRSANGVLLLREVEGKFVKGETIEVDYEGSEKLTFTVSDDEDFFKLGIFDTHKIEIPDYILGVIRIVDVNSSSNSKNLFDYQYQMKMYNLWDLANTSMINYTMTMKHLDLMNFVLNTNPQFEFNRHDGNVYPVMKWGYDVNPGDYLLLECYRMVDPSKSPKAWNDTWLKRYTVALVKRQWGANLRKWSGIQLAGGVTLNGAEIYQEAVQEAQALEDELKANLPVTCFMIG